MSGEQRSPDWINPEAAGAREQPAGDRPGIDATTFAHLVYGELVKQFGRNTMHTFSAWDKLADGERGKWLAALAVVHAQIFPHGPPATDRYPSAQAKH